MSGLGSSIYCKLPDKIVTVLEAENGDERSPATRLACTIGAQSGSVEVLKQMLLAGMKIARFDFTTGDVAFHLQSYKNLRQAMQETNTLCAVMLNPVGPDIQVLNRPSTPIQLAAGQQVRITNDTTTSASHLVLPVNWPGSFMQGGLSIGSSIFVGQYMFTGAETTSAYLTVQSVEPNSVQCVVNNACTLEGVSLTVKFDASVRTPLPSLGAQDEATLVQWVAATKDLAGNAGSAEFLALPRTRSAADVVACREVLARVGLDRVAIAAKIEDMEGLVSHADVLSVADAVIFSRGCLGTVLEPEKVFLAQKMLLHTANSQGKPVFVTRVVDTMTDAPRPTRAEATDVANLVLDGADGVLLGSETFRGKYPVEVVRTVAAICRSAEEVFDNYAFYRSMVDNHASFDQEMDRAEALASGAVRAAHKMQAKLIVVFTVTGRTARLLAKYRPQQPILTVVCTDADNARFSDSTFTRSNSNGNSADDAAQGLKKVGSDTLLNLAHLSSWSHGSAAKRCLAYRGALPIMVDAPRGSHAGDLLEAVLDYAKANGLVASGDRVVVSQCPRTINSEVMSEAGVVQLITVDHKLD